MQKQSSYLSTPQHTAMKIPHHFHFNNKKIILDEEESCEFLVTRLQNSRLATQTTRENYSYNYHSKEWQRVLKTQRYLSKLQICLNDLKCINLLTRRHFSSLSSLSLSFRKVQGVQFKALTSLKHLTSFSLSSNYQTLDPKSLEKLMKAIRKVPKISNFSLTFFACNKLSPLHYQTLSLNLSKFTHLKTLKLSFEDSYPFTSRDMDTLASALHKLTFLTQIDLTFDGKRTIQELILVKIFKAFQSMKNLSALALNLKYCAFAFFECDDGSILESFKCLVALPLKRLSLNIFWNFSDQNLRELSEVLKELISLKCLCLNFYKDFNIPFAGFASALAKLTSLTCLNLNFPDGMKNKNLVQNIGCAFISLQNLVSLKLDFRWFSKIQNSHLKILFANLKVLNCIKYLELGISNQKKMTDSSLEVLGESLQKLNLLRNLSLDIASATRITNKGIEALCYGIQGLLNPSSLNLQLSNYARLTKKAIQKISNTLKNLVSLYSVELNFEDCLNISNYGELFRVLAQMKNIQEITLWMSHSKASSREVDRLKKIKNVTANLYLSQGWIAHQPCCG